MKRSKKPKDTDKVFDTRRAAFRAAKRDNGVPVGKQPYKVAKPRTPLGDDYKLDNRNRRLYIFRILVSLFGFGEEEGKEVNIREDKKVFYSETEKQSEHFNAGEKGQKLRKHYYFRKK